MEIEVFRDIEYVNTDWYIKPEKKTVHFNDLNEWLVCSLLIPTTGVLVTYGDYYMIHLPDTNYNGDLITAINKDRFNENMKKLDSYLILEDNWNNNGAKNFSYSHVQKVRELIYELAYQPKIFPTGRNSIQLEFENGNEEYLEIEIFEDAVSLYLDNNDSEIEEPIEFEQISSKVREFYAK